MTRPSAPFVGLCGLWLAGSAPAAAALPGPPNSELSPGSETPADLVLQAETLILAGRFDEARPLLDALARFPETRMQSNFLEGYVALETGDPAAAERRFRAVAQERPDYSRARIELARALLAQGKRQEADEQYQLAQQDRGLAPEVAEMIKRQRRATAGRADWRLRVEASVTADSNVTNATGLGLSRDQSGATPPAPLDPSARPKAGIGSGVSATAGVRVSLSDTVALTAEAEGYVLDYVDARGDDESVMFAAGPELTLPDGAVASLQLTAFERWYGGVAVHAGFGVRAHYAKQLSQSELVSLDLDASVFDSGYGADFGGKQANIRLGYQAVLDESLSGSIGVNVRREWLRDDAYSSLDLGFYGGLSHYLGENLTGGVTGGVSRALFDSPLILLSPEPRSDWRFYAVAYLTTRRPIGWSVFPTLTYSYNRTSSSVAYYRAERHRLRMGLTRSF